MPLPSLIRLAAGILLIGGLLSLVTADYSLRLLNLAVISAVAVIGLNFAFGAAGLISMGHAAFVGVGAYAQAILTTKLGWSPWLALAAAVGVTSLVAALLGFPLLRLKGHYLALATLGLNVSFSILATNWIELTGGTNGLSGIPELSIAGFVIADERRFLWFALVVLALVAAGASALLGSRHGRAMMAVRDDETAAAMAGIGVANTKVAAFVLSAACAGLAGGLFASHIRFVAPEDFGYAHSITFLNVLTGLTPPTSGTVRFDGRDITRLATHKRVRAGLGRTFQHGRLFGRLSVLENVMTGAAIVPGYGAEEVRAVSLAMLQRMGLAHEAETAISSLPYGRRRMVELCRALACGPQLLLLDEPAAGLNSGEVDFLVDKLRELRAEHSLSVVLIEHNMGMVMRLAQRICVLNFGTKIAEGPPAQVQADPAVLTAYLGEGYTHADV